jgi:hypothetical protein
VRRVSITVSEMRGEERPLAPQRVLSLRWTALQLGLLALALALTYWLTVHIWRTDGDVSEYATYARAFWSGQPPFSALPREYPPLALVPFSLALVPAILDASLAFGLWMGLLCLVGYVGFLRFSSQAAALRYAAYLLLAGQATLLARYDLVPALATLAALWAAQHRRFLLAYALLAAGILLKLYPLALLPVFMIEHYRARLPLPSVRPQAFQRASGGWSWRLQPTAPNWAALRAVLAGAALCLGLVAATSLAALMRNPSSAFSSLTYVAGRPIQVESAPASVLWLGTLLGIAAHFRYAFGSDGYLSPLSSPVEILSLVALAAGGIAVFWRQLRGDLTLTRACLVCLCLALLTSKVFSTQYLLWVLPFAAEAGGDEIAWGLICALTFVEFPLLYPFNRPDYPSVDAWYFMLVLALRNVLLAIVALRALLHTGHARKAAAPVPDASAEQPGPAAQSSPLASARVIR